MSAILLAGVYDKTVNSSAILGGSLAHIWSGTTSCGYFIYALSPPQNFSLSFNVTLQLGHVYGFSTGANVSTSVAITTCSAGRGYYASCTAAADMDVLGTVRSMTVT